KNREPPSPTIGGKKGFFKIKSIKFGVLTAQNIVTHTKSFKNKIVADELTFSFFKGQARGAGFFAFLPPYPWKLSLRIGQISLHEICDQIPGFKDALSGRVTTALTLKGNGGKLSSMNGAFYAKTLKNTHEPLRISQEFIRKLTGKKGRLFFFQKYRPYNKGVIEAQIDKGIITFKSLELSHKFLGFKDLSIAVSRFSNKISIKDLIWEILQVSKSNVNQPIIKTK
ncbi:MAG: hypothetical protein DSY91_03095, partial [Deltaproteobacteria bacterium]